MHEEYDFSQSVANPYVRRLHGQVTMSLDNDLVARPQGARRRDGHFIPEAHKPPPLAKH